MYKLYARPGWGSVLVEAQLAWYGLDYELEELDDLFASAAAREQLAPVNPLAQIPTLVLPDGQVMTESAAITLHLADVTGSSDLVPAAGEAVRPKFLRWLVFSSRMSTRPSPIWTTRPGSSRSKLPGSLSPIASALTASASGPKSRKMSAVRGFSATASRRSISTSRVMTRWEPRRAWFAEHRPALHAVALSADAEPKLAGVWQRNFPND